MHRHLLAKSPRGGVHAHYPAAKRGPSGDERAEFEAALAELEEGRAQLATDRDALTADESAAADRAAELDGRERELGEREEAYGTASSELEAAREQFSNDRDAAVAAANAEHAESFAEAMADLDPPKSLSKAFIGRLNNVLRPVGQAFGLNEDDALVPEDE